MKHADENIQAALHVAEQSQYPKDILAGPVRVGNQYIEFAPQLFFKDTLSVYIPTEFEDMPEHLRKLKYPYEQRPQIIKSDGSGSINFTFNWIDQDLQEQWVKQMTDGMKSIIQKANPSNVFFSEGIEVVDNKQIGFFDFKSPALDGFIYHVMYFFELEGKTIMGTFNCLYIDHKQWRDFAFQVMRTIKVVQEDEKGV
ncbi:hypothetical protein [Paenibacillus sp. 481]|uniref:hypothetical protein n=1 Tax=Paenibacillus sp. 481 TaxID=2835869 RepID=UPI001E368C18|nr:hypothetical protein [Paenibacillus sp. 481]UHA74781.1 hypothetical protein KIK04_06895 [Paenibacillus sp. 481]